MDWLPEEHPQAAWLGQQFNVRGQAMLVLRRRVAENLMIVGGANTARYGMLAATLASLALNLAPPHAKFALFDRSIKGARWNGVLRAVADSLLAPAGFDVRFCSEAAQAEAFVGGVTAELDRRKVMTEEELIREPSLFAVMTELDTVEALRRKPDAYGGLAVRPPAKASGGSTSKARPSAST